MYFFKILHIWTIFYFIVVLPLFVQTMYYQIIYLILFYYATSTLCLSSNTQKNRKNMLIEWSTSERILQCMGKIYNSIDLKYKRVLIINNGIWNNFHSSSAYVIMSLENSTNVMPLFQKFDLFLLSFLNMEQFKIWLEKVYKFHAWNPNAKFVVSIFTHYSNETEIFKIAWKYYVININLILIKNDDILVCTYFPYKDNCTINTFGDLVFNCEKDLIPTILFPDKVPLNFRGCVLKYIALKMAPHVLDTSIKNKDLVRKAGFEVTILHTISKYLNITEEYLQHNFSHWGDLLPNGSYTQMFGLLQKNKVDLVLGLAIYDINATEFETLEQAVFEYVVWLVPTASEFPLWTNLLNIFKMSVWIYLACAILVNTFAFWIYGRRIEIHTYSDMSECFAQSCEIFLQRNTNPPKVVVMRILFAFWSMFCIIVYTAHQSQLVSVLTKPQFKPQISNLNELLHSDLKFGFYPYAKTLFQSNSKEDKYILDHAEMCPIDATCVNRTAFTRKFATLKNRRQFLYYMKKYIFPDGRPMLYGFQDGYVIIPKFDVRKGFPLSAKFNALILRLFANGLIDKWDKDITFVEKYQVRAKLTSLSLNHLTCGFIYWFIGITVASFVFLCEVARQTYFNSKQF